MARSQEQAPAERPLGKVALRAGDRRRGLRPAAPASSARARCSSISCGDAGGAAVRCSAQLTRSRRRSIARGASASSGARPIRTARFSRLALAAHAPWLAAVPTRAAAPTRLRAPWASRVGSAAVSSGTTARNASACASPAERRMAAATSRRLRACNQPPPPASPVSAFRAISALGPPATRAGPAPSCATT